MIFIFIVLAAFILFVLGLYLFATIAFKNNYKTPAPAFAYHHIENHCGFPATKLAKHQFETQMLELKRRDYKTLTPDEFLALRPENSENKILLSFDDTYETVYKNAIPILRSLNYTATLFVIADYIGKKSHWDVHLNPPTHMTEEELRKALEMGFTLGSHTMTHPDLTCLPMSKLREELLGSRKRLEDLFGQEIKYLAYPFGRYSNRVKAAVQECGYKAAFTINRPMRQKTFDPFCIPVTGIYGIDTMRNFISKVNRNGYFWIEASRDKIINRFASGTTLVKGCKTQC